MRGILLASAVTATFLAGSSSRGGETALQFPALPSSTTLHFQQRLSGIVTAAYNVFLTEGDYGSGMYDSDGGVSASSER